MGSKEIQQQLALYAKARTPGRVNSLQSWEVIQSRIAAGDPGPTLDTPGASAVTTPSSVGKWAWLILGVLLAVGAVEGTRHRSRLPKSAPQIEPGNEHPVGGVQAPRIPSGRTDLAPPTCHALDGPYASADQLLAATAEGSGTRQPWRGYLETMPADRFVDGVGVWLNPHDLRRADEGALVKLLAEQGVRRIGMEIGWGQASYVDERIIDIPGATARILAACKQHGIRPLLRLTVHEARPCPLMASTRRLAADARAGDRMLRLIDTTALVPGRSGLSALTSTRAAEILFSNVEGNSVTLSRPLPWDMQAGTKLAVATLKYRPFAAPGTPEHDETAQGWTRFVDNVAALATRVLDSSGHADRGFDLEIGQSQTFAADFLSLGRYYEPASALMSSDRTVAALLDRTAAHVQSNPDRFRGVRLINGFSRNDRLSSSVAQHPRFNGLGRSTWHAPALSEESPPAGTVAFPELDANTMGPRSFFRDLSPIASTSQGVTHGRLARTSSACAPWIAADVVALGMSEDRAEITKAKTLLRQYTFFLNKGAETVLVDALPVSGEVDERGHGFVSPQLLAALGGSADKTDPYPVPLALKALRRTVGAIAAGSVRLNDNEIRRLEVRRLSDCHDHMQIAAPGSTARFYNRDVFTFLPFQANRQRHVVAYYVMTRDVRVDLPPEIYRVTIGGVGTRAQVRSYDPIKDRDVPVAVVSSGADVITVEVEATDSPRLLILQQP